MTIKRFTSVSIEKKNSFRSIKQEPWSSSFNVTTFVVNTPEFEVQWNVLILKNNLLSWNQSGFTPRRSGINQLLSVVYLKSDFHLPKKKCFICFKENHLKMINIAFHFILKALFVLEIFKLLPLKNLGKKRLD